MLFDIGSTFNWDWLTAADYDAANEVLQDVVNARVCHMGHKDTKLATICEYQ